MFASVVCFSSSERALSQTPDSFNPVTNSTLTVYGIAVQPDKKVVIAGYGAGNYLLARVNSDGTPDTNFQSQTVGEINALGEWARLV